MIPSRTSTRKAALMGVGSANARGQTQSKHMQKQWQAQGQPLRPKKLFTVLDFAYIYALFYAKYFIKFQYAILCIGVIMNYLVGVMLYFN
jgi:hypothetical protein